MEQTFWIALGASALAAAVTALGIQTVRRFEGWARGNVVYFISYAAGVLIAASFLHLVPESFATNPHAAALLLAGFTGMHLFHRFLCAFVCERHHVIQPGIGITPVLGIAFHSFIDGMVYSVTYEVSLFTGTLAAVGMVLHEFPEGIVTYLLLLHGGFQRRSALFTALAAAALTTPIGMLVSYPQCKPHRCAHAGGAPFADGRDADLCGCDPPAAGGRAPAPTLRLGRLRGWRGHGDIHRTQRMKRK